ncbi:exonuclease subunit SbcD [Curvibacter sp. HBC61]|uniref:Nuclease SbcCD subunit D n=1 Tax=Curvibacter cyanobacteriorum TaxID=3026422 RepID=A0ABT5MVU9_9BURK|nr:exonuclease subunit SbcD [Curvibacter sp. HBC61]MDD0837581.1 exonuclease subunit SbcD [Curvibacter sp. HBC61]
MRILHTSDWHLGQHFMGKSRQAEHQALIDWLLQQVQAHAVDAVLVAGDLFDTGTPPSYARELYSQCVVRLHEAGVPLLLLGGNHDSVAMLRENQSLLACLGATVVPSVLGEGAEALVELPQRASAAPAVSDDPTPDLFAVPQGTGAPGCLVCAIPYLRARDLLQSQAGQSAEDKQADLQQAIQAYYERVYQAALQRQADWLARTGQRVPIIATGHLTTVGASASESVREIYVGALEAFPTRAFPPADYIALGHIHRPQKVGGLDHIRYSGSPLALSFDEARQRKEVLLVDLDARGLRAVTALPVPVFQPLMALRGSLSELPAALAEAAQAGRPDSPVWLEVTVTEDDYLSDLPQRLQALTEGLPVELLRLRRERGTASARLSAQARETLDELSPQEVFARRLQQETQSPEWQQALSQRYQQVLSQLQEGAA